MGFSCRNKARKSEIIETDIQQVQNKDLRINTETLSPCVCDPFLLLVVFFVLIATETFSSVCENRIGLPLKNVSHAAQETLLPCI